jgi:hypothetical protein
VDAGLCPDHAYRVIDWHIVYINGSKGLSTSAKPDAPVPDASYPTSFPANAQDFDNNIGTFKKNGGTIINLCSRIMRVRSHAESTKNAANRVQSDNDKLAIFIFSKERKLIRISYPRNDEAKLSLSLRKFIHLMQYSCLKWKTLLAWNAQGVLF